MKKKIEKKGNGWLCFDCAHQTKSHGSKGCSLCSCQISIYDYEPQRAVRERKAVVDQLYVIHESVVRMNERVQKVIDQIDSLATEDIDMEVKAFIGAHPGIQY